VHLTLKSHNPKTDVHKYQYIKHEYVSIHKLSSNPQEDKNMYYIAMCVYLISENKEE